MNLFSAIDFIKNYQPSKFFGSLDYNLPICVLQEILITSGFYSSKEILDGHPVTTIDYYNTSIQNYISIIDLLNKISFSPLHLNYSIYSESLSSTIEHSVPPVIQTKPSTLNAKQMEDFSHNLVQQRLNLFINPLIANYTLPNLFQAMDFFLHLSSSNYNFQEILDQFKIVSISYGLQTPDTPYSLNCRLLYILCRINGVTHFKRELSISELYEIYRYTGLSIKQLLYKINSNGTKGQLAQIVYDIDRISNDSSDEYETIFCPKDIVDRKNKIQFNYQEISDFTRDINNLSKIRNRINPLNVSEAICLAAINFQIDISSSSKPIKEYKHLCEVKNNYYPKDELMLYCYQKNKNFFNLNHYFNPYLPFDLYSHNYLYNHINLFFRYSYTNSTSEDIYLELQTLIFEENFYLGWLPSIVNSETPVYLDNVNSIPSEDLVCLGIRDERLEATTWTELNDLFRHTLQFNNPFVKNKFLLDYQIIRLLLLCRSTASNESLKLLDTIQYVKCIQKQNNNAISSAKNIFDHLSSLDKNLIYECLQQLCYTCLYMRGWNGSDQMAPIQEVPPYNPDEVEEKTIKALDILIDNDAKTNPKNFIFNLPLIIWKNEFIISSEVDQGITIGDRIDIISKGNSTNNISSCIRMSSNSLLTSYVFYCNLFEFKIPFSADQIKVIY